MHTKALLVSQIYIILVSIYKRTWSYLWVGLKATHRKCSLGKTMEIFLK